MGETCGRISIVLSSTAIADPHAQSPEREADKAPDNTALLTLVCLLRVAATALVACSFARAAWRVRGEPWDLAFVAGSCAVLAALFWCLRRAERLTPASPAEERRRLQVAVWALSTALSCAFAYRISLLMPIALVIVIWCMTSIVVLMGFYMLVLFKDQQYEALDDVDCDAAAGDGQALKKINNSDELV
ncbi:uncharacterized protein LOC133929695 [Phragmites australis]|uniref:uncharacterized protein LOC133929695 n=1 Tax=Phragmites australis TaxID=29695 RepID=UPI002D787E72|nr:uncharacterized protein LOC133929695 [Phragmites australis]